MPESVHKVIEIVGTSTASCEQCAAAAGSDARRRVSFGFDGN